MAAIDNHSSIFDLGSVTNLSTPAFAVGGSNRVLYVFAASGAGGPVPPVAVRWGGSGGAALTQISTSLIVTAFGFLTTWRLINPTAQTSTVYVDWGTIQDETFVQAVSVTGANQATPNGVVAEATGTGTNVTAPLTVNIASVSGNLTLSCAYILDGSGSTPLITPDGSQTALDSITQINEAMSDSYETAAGATTVASYTWGGPTATTWGIQGFAINDAAAVTPGYYHDSQVIFIGENV